MTKISGIWGRGSGVGGRGSGIGGRGSGNGDLSFAPTAFMSHAYGNIVNANSFQLFRSLL